MSAVVPERDGFAGPGACSGKRACAGVDALDAWGDCGDSVVVRDKEPERRL